MSEEIVSQLVEAISTNTETNILIDQIAASLSNYVKDDKLYTIPFNVFQKIISKTEVIPEETISILLSKALQSYSSLAYVLLPLIDCGNIGPQKALTALAPLMDAPLLQQLKKIPPHAFDPKPTQPQTQQNQQNQQQNYRQNSYNQNRYNQPQQRNQQYNAPQQNRRQQVPLKNQPPVSKETIHEACESGNFLRVRQLLEQQPKLLNSANAFDDKPLHKAVWGIHPEIVKYLLDKGANVNVGDREGLTPLHKAISKKSLEIVKLLLSHGANPSLVSLNNASPIFTAASAGNPNIVAELISAGGDINLPSQYLDTPLHIAAKKGYQDICMMLCMQGANPNARNNRNETPYDLARDQKIKDMLIRYGYKPKRQYNSFQNQRQNSYQNQRQNYQPPQNTHQEEEEAIVEPVRE